MLAAKTEEGVDGKLVVDVAEGDGPPDKEEQRGEENTPTLNGVEVEESDAVACHHDEDRDERNAEGFVDKEFAEPCAGSAACVAYLQFAFRVIEDGLVHGASEEVAEIRNQQI